MSIASQQLSTKAAATIFRRFCGSVPARPQTDPRACDDADRRSRYAPCGFSRPKVSFIKDLAGHVLDGRLDLKGLKKHPDDEVMRQLVAVKGIGRWTAEIFLMFRLGRPDILPADDLGLMNAVHRAYGLRKRPDAKKLRKMGEAWRPYRSVAAWYLWQSLRSEVAACSLGHREAAGLRLLDRDRQPHLRANFDLACRDRRRRVRLRHRTAAVIIGRGLAAARRLLRSCRMRSIARLRAGRDRLRPCAIAFLTAALQRLALERPRAASRRTASRESSSRRTRRRHRARRRASPDRRRALRWCCAPRSRAASACRWRNRTPSADRSPMRLDRILRNAEATRSSAARAVIDLGVALLRVLRDLRSALRADAAPTPDRASL